MIRDMPFAGQTEDHWTSDSRVKRASVDSAIRLSLDPVSFVSTMHSTSND